MDALSNAMSSFTTVDAAGAKAPKAAMKDRDLERAAKDFESVFIHRMLEEMKNTVGDSGLLEDSASEQTQGMVNFYLAQDLGQKGGFGLWKDIARQMKVAQATNDAQHSQPHPIGAAANRQSSIGAYAATARSSDIEVRS